MMVNCVVVGVSFVRIRLFFGLLLMVSLVLGMGMVCCGDVMISVYK